MKLIGIDTGGTFTDFVLFDGARLRVHKVLSTPKAPEQAILQGIREMGLDPAGLKVVHGSTVATNAALEGKGVRTAYITNRGFADVLSIGRQARERLYDLQPIPQLPPVPRALCLETGGRLSADGQLLVPLTRQDLENLHEELVRLKPQSVAVNLLFSYLDSSIEQAIGEIVPEGVFVSLSSQVLPEIREYERGMATWLNAWVGPLVEGYLARLQAGLPAARVAVMQSSGETIAAEQAAGHAVRMLLSGPAGGLVGARFVAGVAGREQLLSFDMGGTSSDVALIDGAPRLTNEGKIGPYPVAVPMVDMHTIGAGGGSIAYLDAGGMLQVGPESAGADPGPACYGRGGNKPTVTDANLVLGRLRPDAFLGGQMKLDFAAARAVLSHLGDAMHLSPEEAALGVIQVANEHMARALRVISIERGVDPKGFTLVSFGGAGGLHVCALAEALQMDLAMVPVHAGVLSALGMLATSPGRQLSHTLLQPLAELSDEVLAQAFERLVVEGREALEQEGIPREEIMATYSLDLRYSGQSYTLNLPWSTLPEVLSEFHRRHELRYGHCMELPVELVNLRVALHGSSAEFSLHDIPKSGEARPYAETSLYGVVGKVGVYARQELPAGQIIEGPALITETVSTTWLRPGWRCEVDGVGNLLLQRMALA